MKKLISISMVILALTSFVTIGYAADRSGGGSRMSKAEIEALKAPLAQPFCSVTVLGRVMSIDKDANSLVVKDQFDNTNKTVYASPEDINSLSIGSTVSFQLSPSTKAENLAIVNPEDVKSR